MFKAGFKMAVTTVLAATISMTSPVGAEEPGELKVAIAAPAMVYGPVWVALAEGLFEKNNVKVDIVSTNAFSTGSAMLVSGSADIMVNTVYPGLRIAIEGKDLVYLMNLSNMGAGINAVIAKAPITSLEELAAKGADCKFITLPSGSGSWAILQGILADFNVKCSVSTAGTMPNVVAGALSGQFDAAMVNPLDAYAGHEAGKVNVIVDPLKITPEQAEKLYPYSHTFSTVFGMKSNLETKREAVTGFIKALREANDRIQAASAEQLGREMSSKLPTVFGSTPVDALELQWTIQSGLFPKGTTAGFISQEDWKTVISAGPSLWGFANLKPDDPSVQYDRIVDMSYFNSAR